MAFGDSNINIKYPNFCIGPQIGTFCTINQDNVTTILRIKNESGGFIGDYALSSNILDEVVALEYVGPTGLTAVMDGATFFTVEKVSSSVCIIKRWEIYLPTASLNLRQQIVKFNTGNYYYDISGMAVERYRRTFDDHNPGGINYLDITSASRITSGMRLFLGPSGDIDNTGAGEYVTVSHTVGKRVYLTSNINYQYLSGDSICFYNYFHLVSSVGFAGDTTKGTMYKLNSNGGVVTFDSKGMYQGISGVRWSTYIDKIACIHGNNAVFVDPYNFYLNWRSIYLNNLESGRADSFIINDIAFNNDVIYKLAQKTTGRDDSGTWATYSWSPYYNFQEDTLLPYTNNLKIYTLKSKMIGQADTTTIYVQVRDQFGVGLLGKEVDIDVASGDTGAIINPLDGKVTTDSNGEASVGYTSGNSYDGWTQITGKVAGSSPSATGSQYVWNSVNIDSNISHEQESDIVFQWNSSFSVGANIISQIIDQMTNIFSIFSRSFFTIPGGDWLNPSQYSGQVSQYLPTLIVGAGDGPAASFERGWEPGEIDPPSFENRITQLTDFLSEKQVMQLGPFSVDFERLKQIAAAVYDLQISQLKLSKHTHWVGGTAYDYLWTQVSLNQFVFVEDAVPKFWSEKNSIDTNIWIRLRPYAFDLNPASLVFSVREVSYAGDTGYNDVASQCTITAFDAGGGIQGLEILYNPSQNFHHNAVIYVHIELYDMAPSPNFIYTDYLFTITPDYKFPYLTNLLPSREQENVLVDSNIYFEIKDLGIGVDISTLEMYVNSKIVTPTIVKISNKQYNITYDPSQDFYYNKEVTVGVRVRDLAEAANQLVDNYRFYIVESADILFTGFDPERCKRGFPRFQDVEFLALGIGNGVDEDTLRVQIHQHSVDDKIKVLPVIYRVS